MSRLFAAKAAAAKAWFGEWNVDVEPDGNAQVSGAVRHRVAISNNRIDKVEQQSVAYSFTQRNEARPDTNRDWQRVHSRFSAAHVAKSIPAHPILRIRQPEQQVEIRLGLDVGLVLSRLVLPAEKANRTRNAGATRLVQRGDAAGGGD